MINAKEVITILTEERYAAILDLVERQRAVTVQDLTKMLNTSESTIRRDLTVLHNMGRLNKVFGGATALSGSYSPKEEDVDVKHTLNVEEKAKIAQYAASLIGDNDFVYLDAGTTTERMIDFLEPSGAGFVTAGIFLARKLARKGFNVFVPGGRVKASTEAIVGSEAVSGLSRYHFTLGFFGTNGVSLKEGFTTPDVDEARVKTEALALCRRNIVLADPSKFGRISPVTFARLEEVEIITTRLENKLYKTHTAVTEVV